MTMAYKTPAQMIEDRLQSRGWTQRVLAKVLNITETKISNIMNGRASISTEIALQLQAVLDIDADELLKLQTSYELAKAQLEFRIDPGVTTRAKVFGDLPITDMIKRGWFAGITDIKDANIEEALCKFFEAKSIDEIQALPSAFKKTNPLSEVTAAQLAWLHRVRQLALDLPAAKYYRENLVAAMQKFKSLLISAEAIRKVPRILMECGVRFIIVESLPSTKIDGVCFWIGESPVVGMTLRYDRIDNFWFVLRHEIEHVLQEHGKSVPMLDAELEKEKAGVSDDVPEEERIANAAAADFCVPRAKLENFIARKAPMFAERDIRGFASILQVHPGLIAGQLQHRTGRYDLFRNHLVKVREIVKPNACADGWGDVAPSGA
jgi:HTH-type transcriptional regulator/antitoxin HigA